jgi:tetraacyldisaccharide 4'-kinase
MNRSATVQRLLSPLSVVYGVYVRLRLWLYAQGWLRQKRLRGAVISIGNISVGGTGKTPMVLWLAEKLHAGGKKVAILSRGYRGSGDTSDEIELMKQRLQDRVEFGVGKSRFLEGKRIESERNIDVFLLDDGFQHLALARDLDIVLIDSSREMVKERLLPAGNLREPFPAIMRADLLVFTRVENAPGARAAIQKMGRMPVFAAGTRLVGFRLLGEDTVIFPTETLGRGPFFAFCGIGNPESFFRDLETWDVPVAGTRIFRDHFRYSANDIVLLERAAAQANAKALVTTEKDAQNLAGLKIPTIPVYVAVIDFELSPETDLLAIVERAIEARVGTAG